MLTRKGFISGFIASALSFFGCVRKPAPTDVRIDATTHESFERTLGEATGGLSDDQRGDVIAAIAALWATSEGPTAFGREAERAIEKGVHGMTVSEILDAVN